MIGASVAFRPGPLIEGFKVLTHGAGAQGQIAPDGLFICWYAALPTRIRFDDAGVHGKPFALDQACVHAATQYLIEQPAKQITFPKTAVSIFGKSRMIEYFIFQPKPAELTIR